MKNEISFQTANIKEIVCKDCVYRDRTTITLGGKVKPVGVTKCVCEQYTLKPSEVLYMGLDCERYEKER